MIINKAKRIELDQRRRTVAELVLRRVPLSKIADKLGVHKSQITRDVQHLSRQWLAESLADTKVAKARELAELSEMEYDAALKFSTKHGPEWLHVRLRIKQRRAKMMGLDDPEVHQIVGGDGSALEVKVSGAALARDVLNDPIARDAARTLTDRIGKSFEDQDQEPDQESHVSGNGQAS